MPTSAAQPPKGKCCFNNMKVPWGAICHFSDRENASDKNFTTITVFYARKNIISCHIRK